MSKNMKIWFVFLLSIIIAFTIIKLVDVYSNNHLKVINVPSTVSNTAYMKALEICGDRGIFDLSWNDFSKGQIKSIYCN